MARSSIKKTGCVGEIETQIVVDFFDGSSRRIKVAKGLQEIKLKDLVASIKAKVMTETTNELTRIVDLFYIIHNAELIDITKDADAKMIDTFLTGYLIGKFIANTKANISLDKSTMKVK